MTSPGNHGLIGNWSPGIGDPNFIGWLTVGLYAIAAILCYCVVRKLKTARFRKSASPFETGLWKLLVVALLFLGVNKQLDLQTALTEFARILARQQGWYERRRIVQVLFIASLFLAGALGACLLLVITRRLSRSLRLAALGLSFIGIFVLVRASSFHHVDAFLGSRFLRVKWNWILEIGGITVVALAALNKLISTNF